jgi:hypothetical protein
VISQLNITFHPLAIKLQKFKMSGTVAGNVGSQYNFTTTNFVDHGDNAWQLTAASLVGLQSVPGLVVL